MLRRVPLLKGLNLRQSDVNRPPEYAQDLRNVEKDSKGQIALRWGYEKVLDDAGIIDLFEYVGAEDDPNRGVLLALKSDGLYRLESGSLVALPEGNVAGQPVWTQQTKPVEYNKVLYWNDPSFDYDLWKFDGYSTYRAGIDKPSVSTVSYSGSAATYYFRIIIKYYDPQGNITYSDYTQLTGTAENIQFNIENISNSQYDGFYQKYAEFTGAATKDQIINSGNLTATGINSHNYIAGDYARLEDQGGRYIRSILIDSVTASTITFNASSVGSLAYQINNGVKGGIEARYEILVYRSTIEFSNYELMANASASPQSGTTRYGLNNSSSTLTVLTSGLSAATTEPLSLTSVYDDSLVRVLPPRGKYLTLYGENMFIGNLGKDQVDFGYASLLSNDSRLEDSIVWSDIPTLSNGSSIETFLVNNIRSVGVSEDGAIKSVYGNDDSLVVHKEKQSYYVNGDFISNTLRTRKAMAEQTGAASHRSTRDVDGGHLYTTAKGVFLSIGGSKPIELSDIIEPLFNDDALSLGTLELANAKSVTDFLREKIYIYVPITGESTGIVLVYDYYYKEWYLHDNIPGDKGFQDVGITSTDIYFASSASLYKRTLNTKTDDGSGITGYYWTGWFDMDIASIVKKFTNMIIGSIGNSGWVATIKGYCNWNKTTEEASNTLTFTSTNQMMDTQVLQVQANSVSYRISNESDNSDLLITCYDVQVEDTQSIAKGDL